MTLEASSPPSILNQVVERVQDLYTLPGVALRVIQLTDEPKVDCRQLKQCIENDPALTCRILKFVNSPIYGLSREIADLNEALAILGINSLKLLVLGFSLPTGLISDIDSGILSRYWRYSLTKAVAGREFCTQLWGAGGDEAFIGGLLQQVGMLALIQQLGSTYTKFLERVWRDRGDLIRLEVASMGFDHTIVSARLLDSWSLPANLISAIGQSRDAHQLTPTHRDEHRLAMSLHLADHAARLLVGEVDESLAELHLAGHRFVGTDAETVDKSLDRIEEKVEQLAELLSVDLGDSTDYGSILMRARDRIVELSELVARRAPENAPAEESEPQIVLPDTIGEHETEASLTRAEAAIEEAQAEFVVSGLEGRLTATVARCRQTRQSIGLGLVEIDRYDEIALFRSPLEAGHLNQVLTTAMRALFDDSDQLVQITDSRYGVLFHGPQPDAFTERMQRLLEGIRRWSAGRESHGKLSMTVSMGIASMGVPPKNFDVYELVERSERCLSAAKHFGGNTLKSIVL